MTNSDKLKQAIRILDEVHEDLDNRSTRIDDGEGDPDDQENINSAADSIDEIVVTLRELAEYDNGYKS